MVDKILVDEFEILEKIKDSQIIKYHTITKRWGNKEFCRNFYK